MTDVEILKNTELGVASLDGQTARGIDFVDLVVYRQLVVVDAGRIIVPLDGLPAVLADAREAGISVEIETQP